MKFLIIAILALISYAPLVAYGQVGSASSPFEHDFGDVKFLDAYFGTEDKKIEVTPGDRNVPFTVVFANVGTQDITGIKGQLLMPKGFAPSDGASSVIYADSNSEAKAGEHFSLTFFVNLEKNVMIDQYPATLRLDFSRLRESGTRDAFFDFYFKVTGESILNLKPENPFLTSLRNNPVKIEISNTGTAPLANLKVVLRNNQIQSDDSTDRKSTRLNSSH